MATLSGKTTCGDRCWDVYVVNRGGVGVELVVARDDVVVREDGTSIPVAAGDRVVVASVLTETRSGAECAVVETASGRGWLRLRAIQKPSGSDPVAHERDAAATLNEILSRDGRPEFVLAHDALTPLGGIVACLRVDRDLKLAAGISLDPKADLVLVSNTENPLHGNVVFLSHKRDGGPTSFYHYSGVSAASGAEINLHPDVVDFLNVVADGVEASGSVVPSYRPVSNSVLACRAVYGPEFDPERATFSLQAVHALGQGIPSIVASSSNTRVGVLSFSEHVAFSGDVSWMVGDYEPVMAAMPRNSRVLTHRGRRYEGVRVNVCPWGAVRGRTGLRRV